ncbi:glycosyltransferase family 4 protein [Brevundimonas sp. SL161]|uniref:glycosyltransferase family 4 protein n=1 Tax=Brevundimonas sp. SL161 TaxID=2804613 RepID=UPI003CF7D6AA
MKLAIHHQPTAKGVGQNVFGASVANHELFQSLVVHGGLERVDFLSTSAMSRDDVVTHLLGGNVPTTEIGVGSIMDASIAQAAGAVLKGGPRIEDLAWLRRRTASDRAYSLIGLIHTIAPLVMRADIAASNIAPTHPWDALVCTSPSVKTALEQMFEEWDEYLADRLGDVRPPRPQLPLIPLGVDGARFAANADRPVERASMRETLGVGPDDVLVLWVGRLSFFEKAFPQPMIRAIAEAANATGKKLHFAMVGWFPDQMSGTRMYRAAAAAYGPDVSFHLLDGNNPDLVGRMWAASDIFISLVDNVQETFGITPLEAMASGLPVIVSDWDGYRYTVQDGEQGMLIPTLIGSASGAPTELVLGHAMGLKTYQQYVGVLAQHTAVDVARAAEALGALIMSPDLRKQMGDAGRRRVREKFDWSVVAPQFVRLAQALGDVRRSSPDPRCRSSRHPAKGEPFRDFAGFATNVLSATTVMALRPGDGEADLSRASQLELDMFAATWRGSIEDCRTIVRVLSTGPMEARAVLGVFPREQRPRMQLSLLWMCKIGVLTWS